MKRLLNSKFIFGLALGYTALLSFVSLIKINESSLPVDFNGADKVFHCGAYFVLTLLWQCYFFTRCEKLSGRPSRRIAGLAILFGIIIEVIQGTATTYRGFEWFDIAANSLGVLLAFLFLWYTKNKAKLLFR